MLLAICATSREWVRRFLKKSDFAREELRLSLQSTESGTVDKSCVIYSPRSPIGLRWALRRFRCFSFGIRRRVERLFAHGSLRSGRWVGSAGKHMTLDPKMLRCLVKHTTKGDDR